MAVKSLSGQVSGAGELTFNLQFELDEESGWFVAHVVELPGCISQGATIDEAKANIAEALEAYLEVVLQDAIRAELREASPVDPTSPTRTAQMLVRTKFEVRA